MGKAPIAKKATKKASPAAKSVAKKPVAKKPVAKTRPAAKAVAKKPVAKKPFVLFANKPGAKKPVAKKPVAKARPAVKAAVKKVPRKTFVPKKGVTLTVAAAYGNPGSTAPPKFLLNLSKLYVPNEKRLGGSPQLDAVKNLSKSKVQRNPYQNNVIV